MRCVPVQTMRADHHARLIFIKQRFDAPHSALPQHRVGGGIRCSHTFEPHARGFARAHQVKTQHLTTGLQLGPARGPALQPAAKSERHIDHTPARFLPQAQGQAAHQRLVIRVR